MRSKIFVLFIMFFVCVFSISCANKGNEDNKIVYGKELVALDSTNIMKYTADELIKRNGSPISDTKFLVSHTGRDKRNIFLFYDRNSKDIIRELNWNINDTTYLLIWYALKDSVWIPFTFDFRDVRAEY